MNVKIKEILVAEGLNVGEDCAKKIVSAGFKIAKLVAQETESKVDDMFIPVLDLVEPAAIKLLDGIDGQEG